jgi:hypothetical protein
MAHAWALALCVEDQFINALPGDTWRVGRLLLSCSWNDSTLESYHLLLLEAAQKQAASCFLCFLRI